MPIGQIFFKKLGSLDKIFSKKIIILISNKVCKDLKANKARWTSPVTKKCVKYENGEKTAAQLLKAMSILNRPSRAE